MLGGGRLVSEYVGCRFDGAKFTPTTGGYYRMVDCSFENVRINNWFCHATELVDCVFSGQISKGFFNGTLSDKDAGLLGRAHNQFEGNDFSRVKLNDVGFRTGVDLRKQLLPQGEEYLYFEDGAGALAKAREVVAGWDDEEDKLEANIVLKIFDDNLRKGQEQLFLRPASFGKITAPVLYRAFSTSIQQTSPILMDPG